MMTKDKRRKQSSRGNIRRKVPLDQVYGEVCREIHRILDIQPTVTADDIHDRLAIPPEGMCQIAHAFRGKQMAGEIVLVKIIRSTRHGQNGNRIGVWTRAESERVSTRRPPAGHLSNVN